MRLGRFLGVDHRRGRARAAAALLVCLALSQPSLCVAEGKGGAAPAQGRQTTTTRAEARTATAGAETHQTAPGVEAQSFELPPRSISDITAVLDREKPDPAKVAAAKAAADAQPPSGLDPADAAAFFYKRAAAAGQLGRVSQELADARKALELIEPNRAARPDNYAQYLQYLALAQKRAGQIREAIASYEKQAGFAGNPANRVIGYLFGVYFNLTAAYVRVGNLAAAHDWLRKADMLIEEMRSSRRGTAKRNINNWRSRVDWAHGAVLDQEGKLKEAERYFRRALAEANQGIEDAKGRSPPPPPGFFEASRDFLTRDLARNLARQGRVVEAEIEARRALLDQLHFRGRYTPESAILIGTLSFVIAAQGRYPEAEKLLRVVLETLENLGQAPDSQTLNVARRGLADTLVAQGRWNEALVEYDKIRQGLAGDLPMLRQLVGHNLNYAMAALHGNRMRAALEVTDRAVHDRSKTLGDKHYETAEARGFHALALAGTGHDADAMAEYTAAVPLLLQGSRQLTDDEGEGTGREAHLRMILEGYLDALAKHPGSAAGIAEGFRIADAARGRAVQKALAASAARSAVGDPALADLVRREQDAQKQATVLNALISQVLALPSDQQDAKGIETLRAQIDQLRSARATIREEIEKRFPDYVNLIDPRPATVAQAQAVLQPGEALIATYVGEEQTYVWAVPKQGPVAFTAAPFKRSEIEAMVAHLRKALDPNASTLGEIPPFDVAVAYKLYAALLKPVEAGWRGAKSLLVVQHGALGQLPFGLLVTAPATVGHEQANQAMFSAYRKVPWLIRQVAVTELPSVTSLTTLRATPIGTASRRPFVGFGDPWFSPEEAAEAKAEAQRGTQVAELQTRGVKTVLATRGLHLIRRNVPKTETVSSAELGMLPRLPETAEEVRQVALALHADPKSDVILGARANEQTVRQMKLDDRRVIMFATHGLVPGDLNGLTEPALALSAPQVAGIKGNGLLTMSEVLGLKLNADWVVLSACNTAAGNGAGAEAVSGLGLAFFYAGTRAILVSNWPVETTSARTLTTALFRREADQPGTPRAEALRQAMLGLIDGPGYVDPAQKRTLFTYAHPIFWAPFSLVGDGGKGAAK
jgi:CHAT domain-containing protein